MKFSTVSSIAMSLALANVVVATPPACLLAAVAQVSKDAECKNGLHDFSCICESNGSTVISTLNSICPNGDADTAVSAFKAQCGEQNFKVGGASSTKASSTKTSASTSSVASSAEASSSVVKSSAIESSAAASSAAASSAAASSAAASSAAASSAAASSAATSSAPLSHSHSSAAISTSIVATGGPAHSSAASSMAPIATAPSESATQIEQTNAANAVAIPFFGAIMVGAVYLF